MSYRGSAYRGPADRSRSPSRFDRRASTSQVVDGRHAGGPPPRGVSDNAPRGPRSQFDLPPRGPPASALGSGGPPRTLRDAPPLGTSDRSRPFRERDYADRRDRSPPPRERSPPPPPPRKFNDAREFPPRDVDPRTARRPSRDGPLSAGSSYPETSPFAGASSFRGGFGRGRGRGGAGVGDFYDRGIGRGGRRNLDDRNDLFRRGDRSPPPSRYGRDLSRDSRDGDRRERFVDHREDDRRPERFERDREPDRSRRDPPPGRFESRLPADSAPPNSIPALQTQQAPPINPERLAILESAGADPSVRRPSSAQVVPPPPAARREPPSEQPAFLDGRKDSTANRYNTRGSSPPAQAPAVPAFSFSVAAPSSTGVQPSQVSKTIATESRSAPAYDEHSDLEEGKIREDKPAPPANAPTAPRAAPAAPKARHASPPPSAPKAPRALDLDAATPSMNRLQGVRSMENLDGPGPSPRTEHAPSFSSTMPPSPSITRPVLPLSTTQSISPALSSTPRFGELAAPTGPRATRTSPAQSAASGRPLYTSPLSGSGAFQGPPPPQRAQTPPSAPSGPRKRSFSVSPKIPHASIPTAPKADRGPPLAPRAAERASASSNRPPERPSGMPPFAPSGPRSLQWNQWRRPGAPLYGEKPGPSIPAKRDFNGEEKERPYQHGPSQSSGESRNSPTATQVKDEEEKNQEQHFVSSTKDGINGQQDDAMVIGNEEPKLNPLTTDHHSATQAFFGKPLETPEDEIPSSSEDEELDEEEDATRLEAKHSRKEKELRSQMINLGAREYRATSPLESIGRLARFSATDLQRINAQRDEDMEMDETISDEPPRIPAIAQPSETDGGLEIMTPQGEENKTAVLRDLIENAEPTRRLCRPSPQPVSLPYLIKAEELRPLEDSQAFQENMRRQRECEAEAVAALDDELRADEDAEEEADTLFVEQYRLWREACEDLEREKEALERLEREHSAEIGPELETLATAPMNPILEGRRLHKFSSEYALEQVLKQSEETARQEQERQERETKKKEADMEKEARLPDQQLQSVVARSVFVNNNRQRKPAELTLVFSYEPPADTFSQQEQDLFVEEFRANPKKWGDIALKISTKLNINRTYKECIHHYYTNKWDGRFRDNRSKKLRGGRRGRGNKIPRSRGGNAMADLNRGEELTLPNPDQQQQSNGNGRPKRAAAPTTFGEKEMESKISLVGQSPAKKPAPGSKDSGNGETGGDKPSKSRKRAQGDTKAGGRKGKPTQPLATIAAAPLVPPPKQTLHSKEELARAQNLEDASLLASFHSGQGMMQHSEGQILFNQEPAAHTAPTATVAGEPERPKPAAPTAKQSASSYWSVPEQTDFFKYIAHFGTDFGAIASHMGTKTQTMIKNHYQRQIDGGRGDLEESANKANARIKRGEDIGPPPTPTPITKRKYDTPQSNAQRPIVPQGDAMEMDEAAVRSPRPAAIPKHTSPPQALYQAKPRFTTSAQSTPVAAPRVVPSPLLAATPAPAPAPTPAPTPAVEQHNRSLQHPLGSRLGFLAEQRSEIRPGMQASPNFRMAQESPPTTTQPQTSRTPAVPPAQPQRTPSNAHDAHYLQSLRQEQEKAMRMQQAEFDSDPRVEHVHTHQQPLVHKPPHTHASPAIQPVPTPVLERKPILEERRPTPPGPSRGSFLPPGPARSTPFSAPMGSRASLTQPSIAALSAQAPFHPSPPKTESSRPGSVPSSTPLPQHPVQTPAPPPPPPPAVAPTPAPEPPKRSNLLSILNDDTEEPKPVAKRESFPSAPTRNASPASGFPPSSAPTPMSSMGHSRRETFGQATMPHSQFHRPSTLGQPGPPTPAPPQPANLKTDPSSGSAPSMQQQPPKFSWESRISGTMPTPRSSNPLTAERDTVSPFHGHRSSALGSLGQPTRVNPSPPPYPHSRTSSLSTQPTASLSRERTSVLNPQHPTGGESRPSEWLQHNSPYAAQPQPPQPPHPSSYTPAPQGQPRMHHAHSSSTSERGPMLPPFTITRDDSIRQEEEAAARAHLQRREREEQEYQMMEVERRRERERDFHHSQRQKEEDMERQRQQQQQQQQHAYGRPPPPPPPPQAMHMGFNPNTVPFGANVRTSGYGLREQAKMDSDMAMRKAEQHARWYEADEQRRRQEHAQAQQQQQQPPVGAYMRDGRDGPPALESLTARRPADEFVYGRRTPHGSGGFGGPPVPPQPPPPPGGRR